MQLLDSSVLKLPLCYAIQSPLTVLWADWNHLFTLVSDISVGLAMLFVIASDIDNLQAASTPLGLVINPWTYQTLLLLMFCVVGLARAKWFLRG